MNRFVHSHKHLRWIIFIFFLIITIFVSKISPINRSELLQNRLVQSSIHTYRSIRKLPDLLFSPYFIKKTKLKVYEISVNPKDLAILNKQLPDDPFAGHLDDQNRLQINGIFSSNDYSGKVDLRFRGFGVQHWNSLQKSWRVNFKGEGGYKGMEALNLVIPSDRWYFLESLAMYRAKKLGLTSITPEFVRLRVNGQDMGVYLSWEQWSSTWLSRNGIPDSSSILAVDDSRIDELDYRSGPYMEKEFLSFWKSYTSEESTSFPELETLINLIQNSDDQTFKALIPHLLDLDKFYAWDVLRAITGSNHQSDNYNNILLFNTATGKFEIIPFDIFDKNVLTQIGYSYKDNDMLLSRRIYAIHEFREKRNELLKTYLTDENLKDDLAYYDSLMDRYKSEFYSDQSKLHSNFEFISTVKEARNLMIEGFEGARGILDHGGEYYKNNLTNTPTLEFEESFKRFKEVSYSKETFLNENPWFYSSGQNEISIGPGTYFFDRSIIIPANLKLIIQPGTNLYLAKDVSIISYSPVHISGNAINRVSIRASKNNIPWGSFLIINTNEKSIVSFADFDSGSGVKINGIISTGMLAAHNSDLEVTNSNFTNSFDDDQINVKYALAKIEKSTFTRTYSDALDLDATSEGSVVRDNKFFGPIGRGKELLGGDAIDISWSNVLIENNIVKECGDKGISVGESSRPLIKKNTLEKCNIGIAVKDSSRARIFENTFIENNIAISAYKKKKEFGGGEALVIKPDFKANKENLKEDEWSEIILIEN